MPAAADASERFLARLEAAFAFPAARARQVMARFQGEMRRGLAGERGSLRMLPAFVGRPRGTERGHFLTLDLGGTNLRTLAVALDGRGGAAVTAIRRFALPPALMAGPGEALFDFLAERIDRFREEEAAAAAAGDLAFTFSFPMAQRGIASGTLLDWTKGFAAPGVVGRDVATLLAAALKRRGIGSLRVAALLNDTVGTLSAASYADPASDMGVILGTGTNACYPERSDRIAALGAGHPPGETIVNLEWGAFDGIAPNVYDRQLDRRTPPPGRQRLEKMVAGRYLGELVRLVLADMARRGLLFSGTLPAGLREPDVLTTAHLTRAATGGEVLAALGLSGTTPREEQTLATVGRIVTTRAARIAATAIASVLTWRDPPLAAGHRVAIDGALFEHLPRFGAIMEETLAELLGDGAQGIRLHLTRDGSGIGAAVVAAVAASQRGQIP